MRFDAVRAEAEKYGLTFERCDGRYHAGRRLRYQIIDPHTKGLYRERMTMLLPTLPRSLAAILRWRKNHPVY
jgi:hypothetical protein